MAARSSPTPFVGREQELERLRAAYGDAVAGHGSLVMVVGEPGIGKTALCDQLRAAIAAQGGRVLSGHCSEERALSLPYLPFVEALGASVRDQDPAVLRRQLGPDADILSHILPELQAPAASDVRPAASIDPQTARYRLFQAAQTLVRLVRAAPGVSGLCLLLEDLHDADRDSLDLFLHLSRHAADDGLLIVGTYRDVAVDRAHPLSAVLAELRRTAPFERLHLHGLTPAQVQQVLEGIAGQAVSLALAQAVHDQTEGNALFAVEVARHLVEEGHLGSDGRDDLQPAPAAGDVGAGLKPARAESEVRPGLRRARAEILADLAVPEGLRDVIGRRLSRLSAECNRLLAVAAIIGRDFRLDTLQAVAGIAAEPLLPALEEASRAAVLAEQARVGVVQYRFAHALIRRTLYEELSLPRRLRIHQQVARVLEAQYAGHQAEHAAELAEHFAHSTDAEDLRKAIDYGEQAAAHATDVYAYGEAVRHLEQALDVQEALDPDDGLRRCDLLLALGEALLPAGDFQRAFDHVAAQALALAETLEDRQRASHACRLACDALFRYGNVTVTGSALYRQWAEGARSYAAPATPDQVYADLALAWVVQWEDRGPEQLTLLTEALALARTLGDLQAMFQAAHQFVLFHVGPAPPALKDLPAALTVADEFCSRPPEGVQAETVALLLVRSALLYADLGDRVRMEGAWRQLDELAERTRDASALFWATFREIQRALFDGDLEASVAGAARLRSRGDELGASVTGAQNGALHGFRARLHLGRVDEAIAMLLEAPGLAGVEPGQGGAAMFYRSLAALGLAASGRSIESRALLEQLLADIGPSDGEAQGPAQVVVPLLEAAVLLGDRTTTARLTDALAPGATSAICGSALTCAARHLGAAAALLGDQEQALRYYEQALEVCGHLRFRPELALTHLGIAELLIDEAASSEQRATGGGTDSVGRGLAPRRWTLAV